MDEVVVSNNENIYRNYFFGYEFSIPYSFSKNDRHQVNSYTRFYNSSFRLDIFYDDLDAKYVSFEDYISSTTSSIQDDIVYETTITLENGLVVRNIDYVRNSQLNFTSDLNVYSYFFVDTNHGAFSFQLKTDDSHWSTYKSDVWNLLSTFKLIPQSNTVLPMPSEPSPKISYSESDYSLNINKDAFIFGLYEQQKASDIYTHETELETHFGTQMFYKTITTNYDSYVDEIIQNNRTPLVTFHFQNSIDSTDKLVTHGIINGEFDSYIQNWAIGMKQTNAPIFVRIANEMNGEWTDWSHKHISNDPDLYKLAYRHIVKVFKDNGANNVKFVWNPNDFSKPNFSWNDETLYYPGDDVVDWIGLTAYNFGKDKWGDFKYFDDLYRDMYFEYLRQFPNKPMMIGEFSSVSKDGNKPYFIKDMFEKLSKGYSNIKLVTWFNGYDGEFDFPYETSTASFQAFKEGLQLNDIIHYPVTKTLPSGISFSAEQNDTLHTSIFTFTGLVEDSSIKNVYINNVKQVFKWDSWKQFDQELMLKNGINKIPITIEYNDGATFNSFFPIYKDSSFNFTTPVGKSITASSIFNKETMTLTGTIPDKHIDALRVNGEEYNIKWSWRQFDVPINLSKGLNEFIFEGLDSNGNTLTSEMFYIFNDGDFIISDPMNYASVIHSFSKTITGMVPDSNYDWVKIDGIIQNLKWSWRQFDQLLDFERGNNIFQVDALYKGTLSGVNFEFPIHKNYQIQTPSIDWLTEVSYQPTLAPQTSMKLYNIGGIVKNSNVNSLSINGENLSFLYDWKQFSYDASLKNGLNRFEVIGYSDSSHSNPLTKEVIYVFNDNDLLISSPTTLYQNIFTTKPTITGMVGNSNITSVNINGTKQDLKWSWRQFDHELLLDKYGNNTIVIDALYEGINEGEAFQYLIKKEVTLHLPSIDFSVPVGYDLHSMPQTSNDSIWIGGFVKDLEPKTLKINGEKVPIKWSWRQIDYTVNLNHGLNAFTIEGFSDSDYQNKIFEEEIFIFNNNGIVIDNPISKISTSDFKEVEVNGHLAYDAYSSVKVNSIELPFLNDWRQFKTKLPLAIGENNIVFEALYESSYKGKSYTYLAKKHYTVNVPTDAKSFDFTTSNFGFSSDTAYETTNSTEWIGFLVKNTNIKSIKVNNEPSDIMYDWRQVSHGVALTHGLNEITILGYDSKGDIIESKRLFIFRN